jgi:Na+-translocating ferredoxin:NAD+ oxidoreductase RNF subunit RnfB
MSQVLYFFFFSLLCVAVRFNTVEKCPNTALFVDKRMVTMKVHDLQGICSLAVNRCLNCTVFCLLDQDIKEWKFVVDFFFCCEVDIFEY